MKTAFDDIEIAILRIMQENGRATIKDMAAKLNLSTTPIFDRIKRMESNGVIKKYVAIVDQKKLGKSLTVFVHISISQHGKNALNSFIEAVTQFPEVIECHHISGDADVMLKLVLENIEAYNAFIMEKLSIIPNIGKVESRFSLSERKNTSAIPIDH